MKNILIIGATSAIAQETARCYAAHGANLYLIGRNEQKLSDMQADLKGRGASEVTTAQADLLDTALHNRLIDKAWEKLRQIDGVLIAHGTLGDQTEAEADYATAEKEFQSNMLSAISLLTPIANKMEIQRCGVIATITSVAGDRGRQSNYIYGAAKAGLNTYLQGLRNRLSPHGVTVLTIKPGFVDTPMTADLDKGPLFASAQKVGSGIHKAMKKKKDVVYLPGFWWGIMCIIKCIPESIFKKLKL